MKQFMGADPFIWWKGVVEDRKDPLFLGRVKVRILGWDTQDKDEMPTDVLPWAIPIVPPENGRNPLGYKEGDWVVGFFRDSIHAQEPIILGAIISAIPENRANPDSGFYDPTPDEELSPTKIPRPPEMSAPPIRGSLVSNKELLKGLGDLGSAAKNLTQAKEQISLSGSVLEGLSKIQNLTSATNAAKLFSDIAKDLVPNPSTVQNITDQSKSIVDKNKNRVSDLLGRFTDIELSDISQIGSVLGDFSRIPNFKDVGTLLGNLGNFSPANLSRVSSIKDVLTDIDVSSLPNNVIGKLKDKFGDFQDFSAITNNLDSFNQIYQSVNNGINLRNLSSIGNVLSNFSDFDLSNITNVGGSIKNIVDSIKSGDVNSVLSQISQLGNLNNSVEMLSSLGDKLLDVKNIDSIVALNPALSDLIETNVEQLAELTGLSDIYDVIKDVGDFSLSGIVDNLLDTIKDEVFEVLNIFKDPNKLPGQETFFGELVKDFSLETTKFDVNKDGKYNATDALLIGFDANKDGLISPNETKFVGNEIEVGTVPISRYPREDQLKEPLTSRLARGEDGDGKIDQTIVGRKKGKIATAEAAAHKGTGVGTDAPMEAEAFNEPATPYAAVYPYNHVYESESGHTVEIDDTPGAERMHWYHRAGTFKEIHPDGTQVVKVKKKSYHFSEEEFFVGAGKSINITSGEAVRIKSATEMNLNSGGDLNQDVGGKLNVLVGEEANIKIEKNAYIVVKDVRILAEGNVSLYSTGDIKFKADGDILMDAKNIVTTAVMQNKVAAGKVVMTEAPLTYTNSFVTDGIFIKARLADFATLAGEITTIPFTVPPTTTEASYKAKNDADNKNNLITEASEPKEGFVLDGPDGDLYKPNSDSDGKAVVLSKSSGGARFYEAVPTGILENVTIQYKHKDGSITSWDVVRPKPKKGNLIEEGRYAGNGNGGREHYRFTKPGGDYPPQMILEVGGKEWVILMSSVRHD